MRFLTVLMMIMLWYGNIMAQSANEVKHHKRQFRGVWIATVRNLDWPSKPGLSVRKQKKEYIAQLDLLKDLGMNAVIVQVRPIADAFYPSAYEPWSEFLTGEQGKPPAAYFDPLEFMIEEAHNRSMEFHAWFNPYRAARIDPEIVLSPHHIYYQHRDWFVEYGKDLYFDPGMVPARKFVEKVIADVVVRYDIDAVHFDDYYYPYRLEGIEFPDSLSFAKYPRTFNHETKDDWRRDNINLLVQELYDTINYIKPWVYFGISTFGVWRNKSSDPDGSDTQTLQTNYDDLYGDALKWLRNGWQDYILPQCYQYMGRPIMDYRIVSQWWSEHNYGTNFYIGQGPFRLGNQDRGERWVEGNEIARQLRYNDSIPNLLGSAYFRSQTFMENPLGINDSLKSVFYKYPAITPASHHDIARTFNVIITAGIEKNSKKKVILNWEVDKPEQVRYYVIYRSSNLDDPKNIIAVTAGNSLSLKKKTLGLEPDDLMITAVDKYRIESAPVSLKIE